MLHARSPAATLLQKPGMHIRRHALPGAQCWFADVKGIKHLQHLAAAIDEGWWRHVAPHSGAVAGGQQQLHYAQGALFRIRSDKFSCWLLHTLALQAVKPSMSAGAVARPNSGTASSQQPAALQDSPSPGARTRT